MWHDFSLIGTLIIHIEFQFRLDLFKDCYTYNLHKAYNSLLLHILTLITETLLWTIDTTGLIYM